MNFLIGLAHNEIFLSAGIAWLSAQIIKTLLTLASQGHFEAERLFGSGGMPSSHSSTVCAMATTAGIQYGGDSFEFGISLILALIVMYDARGVRREAGAHAHILNELVDLLLGMGEPVTQDAKLKELIGHTPLQVFFGALLGVAVSLIICFM